MISKSLGKSDFLPKWILIFGLYPWYFREVNFENFQKVTFCGYLSIWLFVIFLLSKLIPNIIKKCQDFFTQFLNFSAINDVINAIMMKFLSEL